MAQRVGTIPEFTENSTPEGKRDAEEVVKSTQAEPETVPEEKETPEPPAEKPAEQKPSEDTTVPSVDPAVQALQEERTKLLKEISDLRGTRRELKQDQLKVVEDKIDELKDLHPEDVQVIDKVLRAKGYMTKQEADTMFYNSVRDQELEGFLEKYPEYKPENDPSDMNWSSLQRELGFYKAPTNPHQFREILERAHRSVPKAQRDMNIPVKQRQVQVASAGSSGVQPSSSRKTLDPQIREIYRRGGWSEEEIDKIADKLPD